MQFALILPVATADYQKRPLAGVGKVHHLGGHTAGRLPVGSEHRRYFLVG